MGWLLAILAVLSPRLVLFLLWLFSTYLHRAFAQTDTIWPVLGFFLLPWTTLWCAYTYNNDGFGSPISYIVLVVAIFVDLGTNNDVRNYRARAAASQTK